MKRFLLIIGVFAFLSCEKVIKIDLDEGAKQFVVDASLDWVVGKDGKQQKIILSKTSGYFSGEYPKVTGATVSVANSAGKKFNFTEEELGIYVCKDFSPKYDDNYALDIKYDGNSYQATDTLRRPISVYNILQTDKGGISNKDREVRIFFTTELKKVGQYFMVKGKDKYNRIPFYFLVEGDNFDKGNMFIVAAKKEWQKGDVVDFEFYHISERYFNYMTRLLAVADQYSGKPLSSPAARIQGNIVAVNSEKQNPLGAFRTTSCLKYQVTLE